MIDRIQSSIDFFKKKLKELNYDVEILKSLPELIPNKYLDLTFKKHYENPYFNLVGSGEQSFLSLEDILDDFTVYLGYSKCFRPTDKKDKYHVHDFIKAELFFKSKSLSDCKTFLNEITPIAIQNFMTLGNSNVILNNNKEEVDCNSKLIDNWDINDGVLNVELGSYGIRQHPDKSFWVYGTVFAPFRFDAVQQEKEKEKPGYHLKEIPKGELGEMSKIVEEIEEFLDANKQDAKIMELIELSDLMGAIEAYIERFGLTLDDLILFKNITKRCFENGKR